MQGHRGLPKNLPQKKSRAKIFSAAMSPSRSMSSPNKNNQTPSSSKSKTNCRENSLGHSRHKINSKQKPVIKMGQNPNKSQILKKQPLLNEKNIGSSSQTGFVQAVLGMMGQLSTKNQSQSIDLPIKDQITVKSSEFSKQLSQNVSSKKLKQSQSKIERNLNKAAQDQDEIVKRISKNLSDQSNWANYVGDLSKQGRTGYGIQYFKNKDKFMGAFKNNAANGHGTYYFHEINKKIMAVWIDNQINLHLGFLIEKL